MCLWCEMTRDIRDYVIIISNIGPLTRFDRWLFLGVINLYSFGIPHGLCPYFVDHGKIWPSRLGCTQHCSPTVVFDDRSRHTYQNIPQQRNMSLLRWYGIPPPHHAHCKEQTHTCLWYVCEEENLHPNVAWRAANTMAQVKSCCYYIMNKGD